MNVVTDFLKKLATFVVLTVLIAILFFSAYSLFHIEVNNDLDDWKAIQKEAEGLLSSDKDVIVWDGITYEKFEFEQKFAEAKQALNAELFRYRMLCVIPCAMFIASAFCLLLIAIWPFRCKECKRWFAVRKRDKIKIKSEKIYTVVENETRSAYSGEVTKITEQHIPGKRSTYKTTSVCKYCGAEKYKYRTIDTPNT